MKEIVQSRQKDQNNQKEQNKQKVSGFPGTAVVCIMELLMTVVAAVLIFFPKISAIDICYILCTAVIVLGIYMIVRYFMTDTFRNLNEYGFSEGTLLVVLGICGMIRAESLAAVFFTCIGVIMLLSCVIKLQYVLDLKRIGDKVWFILLIITLVLICCSIAVILNPFSDKNFYNQFTYKVLLADGVISLLVILYLMLRIKILKKKEQKELIKKEQEKEKEDREKEEQEKEEQKKEEQESEAREKEAQERESQEKEEQSIQKGY